MNQLVVNKDHNCHEMKDSLCGQLLIAMPGMEDQRFSRSLIYICTHSAEGAMGLIINRPAKSMDFSDLLSQVLSNSQTCGITIAEPYAQEPSIHIGGPVETGRGFVLHSSDYHVDEHTFEVSEQISLTSTLDILRAIASGDGPDHALLALGYAGWSPGQLENEIGKNGWLNCTADLDLIFDKRTEQKYNRAFKELGIDPTHLVTDVGHA